MQKKIWIAITCFLLHFFVAFGASCETLAINKVNDARAAIISDVLTLALQKSSPDTTVTNLSEKLPFS